MNIALYPDGIFATAFAGMLFEIYYCSQKKEINKTSFFIILILSVFALFSRTNGIIAFIPLIALSVALKNKNRAKAIILIVINITILITLSSTYKHQPQGATFPLILWETVNFMQPRAAQVMTTQNRVTQKTIETLEQVAPKELITKYYDPEYWDPLVFDENGPKLGRLTKQQQKILRKEFIKYNLWNNFPEFIASRVHVFLASTLASNGLPWPGYTEDIIAHTSSISIVHPLKELNFFETPDYIFFQTFIHRGFFWSSLYGILIILTGVYAFKGDKKDIRFIIFFTYLMQIGGIFLFNIAAENRYMLCITISPLVLLPILADRKIKNNMQIS